MLIKFRVENHRSLRDEQTLSLVAANLGESVEGPDCLLRTEALKEELLPAAAVYGANASGKTNVLLALQFMQRAITDSYRRWDPDAGVPQEPFALSSHQFEPSTYEVDMLVGGVRYQYGFSLDASSITAEWLYAWTEKRERKWFRREGQKFSFGTFFHGENQAIRELTRTNSLFLSVGAQSNHALLRPIYSWFVRLQFEIRSPRPFLGRVALSSLRRLYQFFDDASPSQLSLFPDGRSDAGKEALRRDRNAIIHLLQAADTGIVDLRVENEEAEDPLGRRIDRQNLQFLHRAEDPDGSWLPLEVESAGTVALLGLATRLVPTLRLGGVLCVDEIEASLHPVLAAALLRLFCDRNQNPNGAQLIFTTHDTNLLGNILGFSPLRRDQIWLTEKDRSGATQLYPLTDYHPRRQENMERGYLQGRYGAVPFLDTLIVDPDLQEPQ